MDKSLAPDFPIASRRARLSRGARRVAFAAALLLLGAGCERQAAAPAGPAGPPRPVRTVTVEPFRTPPSAGFVGHIEAQDDASLAFRISGRMTERLVGVGAQVRGGQVVAQLDPENEMNALRSARAALAAANGVLRQAENQFDRQDHLKARGVTSQADFEAAEQARTAARAQVAAAKARLKIAEDEVGFTTLKADAPGVVTAIGAEPGEVVQAGRMVVTLARRGGRDAVFEIPEAALRAASPDDRVTVTLNGDPQAMAAGLVREVSPQADPVTRTFRVRVGLTDPSPAFRLGAAVTGAIAREDKGVVAVPASAIVRTAGETGVWLVDPKTKTVSLRKLQLIRSDAASAVVAKGLELGDIVVTAGVNQLREGQSVLLIGVES